MTLAADIAVDLDLVDGLEPVTVTARDLSWLDVAAALPRRISTREVAASNGAFRAGDKRWHTKAILGNQPKLGDILTPDATGEDEIILGVDSQTLQTRLALVTRRVVIEGSESVTATIETPANQVDPSGARIMSYIRKGADLTARLQPLDTQDQAVENGIVGPNRRYRLYTRTRLSLAPRDTIRVGARRFAWVAAASEEDMTTLPSVDLTEVYA